MKKFLPVLLALMVCIGAFVCLSGCGDDAPDETLEVVSEIKYDGQTITWKEVANAVEYEIIANDVSIYTGTSTSFNYSSGDNFTFVVIAKGDGITYADSPRSESFSVIHLSPVTNMQVADGVLTWDAVPNATGYRLKINGVEKAEIISTNAYDALPEGDSITIFVKPVIEGANTFGISDYSNEKIINLINSPQLMFDNSSKTVYWNSIQNANGYKVRITKDGNIIQTASLGANVTSYTYDYTYAGDYYVSVQAVPRPDMNLDVSKFSEPMKIVRLSNPTSISLYQTESNVTNVMFDDVAQASSFLVKVNGLEHSLTTRNSFEYSFPSSQAEQISEIVITSLGNGYTVLDANESVSYNVTKLSAPTGLTLSGTRIMWNTVNKASGYEVFVDGNIYTSETNELALPVISGGTHQICVRARGNSTNVASSDISLTLDVEKLRSPANLNISNEILTWSPVLGAENYVVYIDSIPYNTRSSSLEIDPNYISYTSEIRVMAIGNGGTKIDSDFSNTLLAHRLKAPESIGTDNDNIKWNSVASAVGYTLRVNDVYKEGITGTSYSWNEFTSGEKRVRVQALGDGSTYFDSAFSDEIIISKLESPQLTIGDTYKWNSVLFAEGYEIVIDSVSRVLDPTVKQYFPDYTIAGVKTVKLRARGNGSTTVSSSWTELTHEVFAEVALKDGTPFTVTKADTTYTIKITEYENGKSYVVNVDGKDNIITTDTFSFDRTSAGKFIVKIAVKGDGIHSTNSTYCPSKEYTILNEVKNIDIRHYEDNGYVVTWSGSTGTTRYKVTYTIYNGENVVRTNTVETSESHLIVDMTGANKIVVSIVAEGMSNNVFDSNAVEETLIPLGN